MEHFWAHTAGDYSAAITGLLLGLTLPPGLPLWMGVVGSFIAIAPGKLIFGGLGHNVFNPALVGRAFLQAAFPTAITTYTPALRAHRFSQFIPATLTAPFLKAAPVHIDGFSGATPLMLQKFEHIGTDSWTLFLGTRAGSSGETCAWLILLCGLYLILRKMMDWRIPAAMLLGALLTGGAYHWSNAARYPGSLVVLFSGGLMLGAMFMATDPVASPVTPRGMWIYGLLMGLVTVVIRYEGGLPEGVMYSILLGNALSPLIDNVTQPRTYGERRKAAA
jgi:electron transport complex protein RnfD